MDLPRPEIDVEEVMRQIRERVRVARGIGVTDGYSEFERRLNTRAFGSVSLENALRRIGAMPPSPPTLRGRLGRLLVSGIWRALAWYTAGILAFGNAVEDVFHRHLDELAETNRELRKSRAMIAKLQAEFARIQSEHNAEMVALKSEIAELRLHTRDCAAAADGSGNAGEAAHRS
jgi:hypothetical protein